jgi:hypothetical protein
VAHATVDNDYCFNECWLPGRVTTLPRQPGAYSECITKQYDGVAPFYMKSDPNFRWVPASSATAKTIPNVVIFNSTTGYYFLFGRMNLTAFNIIRYTEVSKIHLDNFPVAFYYISDLGTVQVVSSGFEVLTCVP